MNRKNDKQQKRRNGLWRKLALCLCGIFLSVTMLGCQTNVNIDKEIEDAVRFVYNANPSPSVGSVGGDWAVKGIVESGVEFPEKADYIQIYKDDICARMIRKDGILDEEYYSTYARVTIGCEAIGMDPVNVEGYNLIEPLDDYEMITGQGMTAAAFALIAADLAGVTLVHESEYVDFIITFLEEHQIYGDAQTSDYVAMAVEALSIYKDDPAVAEMLEKCIEGLAQVQQSDGGYNNCESTAEAIIAVTCAGINPLEDSRFIKDGNTMLDGLLKYKTKDGYLHIKDADMTDAMAAEKALLALDSLKLIQEETKLYAPER